MSRFAISSSSSSESSESRTGAASIVPQRSWARRLLSVLPAALFTLAACGGGGGSGPVATPTPTPGQVSLRYPQLPPLPEAPVDAANEPTPARVELGTYLFFDPRLSTSGFTACNNCHVFNTSFQDNLVKPRPDASQGDDFFTLKRNTESLFNITFRKDFFRDGRVHSLTQSMTDPWIEENQRLGETHEEAARHLGEILRGIPGYAPLFRAAYDLDLAAATDDEIFETAGLAFGVWVRQVVSRSSPFDRYNAGDETAIDDSAKRGAELFVGRAGCVACHYGPNITDGGFHNVSSSPPDAEGNRKDEGRFVVTGEERDRGSFQTPTLRHASRSSPYFHDGSKATLLDVIQHFNAGAGDDPNRDLLLGAPLGLSDDDVLDLIAFIRSLRGESVVLWGPNGPLFTQADVDQLQRELLPR